MNFISINLRFCRHGAQKSETHNVRNDRVFSSMSKIVLLAVLAALAAVLNTWSACDPESRIGPTPGHDSAATLTLQRAVPPHDGADARYGSRWHRPLSRPAVPVSPGQSRFHPRSPAAVHAATLDRMPAKPAAHHQVSQREIFAVGPTSSSCSCSSRCHCVPGSDDQGQRHGLCVRIRVHVAVWLLLQAGADPFARSPSRGRDQLVQRGLGRSCSSRRRRRPIGVGARPHRYTQGLQRGCSSVGRAQQSHC